MNVTIEQINGAGRAFVQFALPMLIQSGVLILILLSVDLLLRKKVRAVFRYWIWMLVLVKLLLPTSLSSPVSLGRWFGDELAYVDMTAASAPEPKVDSTPKPAVEAPPVTDIRHVETITQAPAVAAVEPTARHLEPAATEPISPPSPAATSLSWQGAALLSWLAVIVAMVLLLLQRALFVRRLVAQAGKANRPMTEALGHCCQRMAVKRRIDLRISASATSPAVCGLSNPVILVPKNLTPSLSSDELRVVLLHELAHIKRGDLWVNLAQTILQIFYFYNPLLWLANAMIRRVREQAVDEMVLVAMGDNARQYPETLVNVAKLAFKRPALSLRLIGVVESKSALTGRIRHILNRPMPKTARLGILSFLVVIVIAAILLPMAISTPGPPELIIKGIVRDAQTGKPIAGARVFDDGYGPMPSWGQIQADERSEWGAITNSAGEYSFLTWPEHHSISVEAPGYLPERESLYDGHFILSKKDEEIFDFALEPEEVSESSGFKKTLPDGVTVELVGICEHPSEGKQWWRPDGSKLGRRPFEKLYQRSYAKHEFYELALKIEDPQNRKLSVIGKGGHVFNSYSDKIWGGFVLSEGKKTLNQSIGIAQGPWKTIAEAYPKLTQIVGDFAFGEAFETEVEGIGTAVGVTVTHTIGKEKLDYRIIAVDRNGHIHTSSRYSGMGGGSWMQTTVHFKDLRIDEIKEFQFQTRPYDWVLFKNVSLKPNFKTDVQVEVEGPAKEDIGSDSPNPGLRSPSVPVIAYEVKLNFADPTVTDGSFHSYQSVSFNMSFHSFDSLKTDTLFGRLLIGQTTLPVLLKNDLITIQDGSVGKTIRSETWPADELQFEKVITLPLKYGQKQYSCPVRVELMRQQGSNPIGSYWFCAYLSGRLPWGAGGRMFEIVNLDQQMEFRAVGDGTDKRDAVLGIDIDGDGKIDHSETGGEQFNLYEPFQIGSKTYRVAEVDPYLPRVVFLDVKGASAVPASRARAQTEGADAADDEMSGRVVDGTGGPAAGAQVGLSTDKIGAMMSDGRLKPMPGDVESRIVETDSNGHFDLGQRPTDGFDLIVAHDKGFAIVGYEDYLDSRKIQLQPWGRIRGQVAQGRYASENNIWMAGLPNPTWLLHKLEHRYETECDANGSFTFEKVPAGWFEAGYLIRTGDSGWSITSRMPVEVKSGETAEITLGGSGRPVVGKFVPPAGYDKSIYFGNGLRALNRTRPDEPRPDDYDRMTKRQQQQWRTQWRKTDQYRQYSDAYWHDPNWRHYTFRINDDGSFRIEDVIAGKYDFTVWIEERLGGGGPPEEIAGYYGTIEVPEMPGGRSDEPLDLGELELSMHEPLRVGDAAPLFEAKTLDGKNLKLIDHRGKFVLLSFWQPVSHPELERLKILSAGYNAAGRLEAIGLGGNDTLEEVKRYVEENNIPWPQIFVGEEFRSGIAKDYRIPGVPWIFLIGPDGRIVANGLRGEKLSSTVLETLESTEQYKTQATAPFSRDKVTDIRLPFTFTVYTLTPDNKPQPGVKVRCLHPRPERAEPIVDMVVESDENGVAKFTITQADLLTDWMYWFSLEDEDYVGSPGVGITPDEGDWTFKVLPAEEFELNVIGDKKPVSGAKVHLQIDHGEGKDWDPKRFRAYENVLTDSAGQARVHFVKGKISMAIAAKDYASKMISGAELSTEKPYEIQLTKGRDITGRVVDANDEPLTSVAVTAKSKGDRPWEEEFLLKGSTDRKGNFTLKNASVGKWEVTARSEDPNEPYFIAPVTVNVRKWWAVKPVKMVAEEGFRLKGKYVTDYRINLRHDAGLPRIEAGVTKPGPSWMQLLRTEKDGTFDIWGFPCRGQGSIRFEGVGGYHNFVEVPKKYDCFEIFGDRLNFKNIPPGTYENIKVHYLLAGMVRGTVVDAAGLIFPGAEITIEPEGTRHKTDEEGKFSIRIPPVDILTLTIRDTKTRAVVFSSEPFSVKEGEIIEENITTRYERRD
jgi:beta-lactamase regulating signal transducer with metallopeptidase domain/peroxiredoxin